MRKIAHFIFDGNITVIDTVCHGLSL